MSRIRTKSTSHNGAKEEQPAPAVALKPLPASGLVVRKGALVEALRVYVPGLSDIQVTEDGEHFWLMLDEGEKNENQATS